MWMVREIIGLSLVFIIHRNRKICSITNGIDIYCYVVAVLTLHLPILKSP